jgi:hypothetical protein
MLFRKIIIFLSLIIAFSFLFVQWGYAECPSAELWALDFIKGCSSGTAWVDPSELDTWVGGVKDLVIKVAERALQFAALFAVWAIVWSGIRYTTSYGDDEKVKKAKSTTIFAIIWLVIALVSFPLVDILLNFIYSI